MSHVESPSSVVISLFCYTPIGAQRCISVFLSLPQNYCTAPFHTLASACWFGFIFNKSKLLSLSRLLTSFFFADDQPTIQALIFCFLWFTIPLYSFNYACTSLHHGLKFELIFASSQPAAAAGRGKCGMKIDGFCNLRALATTTNSTTTSKTGIIQLIPTSSSSSGGLSLTQTQT